MPTPFISRVRIKNFRNFHDIDVELGKKQVIIGENNVGKSNFLRAIQLILDPQLNEEDRYLEVTDFNNGLEAPMEKGEIIEISIEIKEFKHNKNLLCQFNGAVIKTDPDTMRLTYRYYSIPKEEGGFRYDYIIFKGENEESEFRHSDRKYLNLKVIKPIRDVESEMKNSKKSPLTALLKDYNIDISDLELIANNIKQQNDEVLKLGELKNLERRINNRFLKFVELQPDSSVEMSTNEYKTNRILQSLKLMLGERSVTETSLGLTNILYMTLILLAIEDKTIIPYFKNDKFLELQSVDSTGVLTNCYEQNISGHWELKNSLEESLIISLYEFLDSNNPKDEGITLLAIEEPEAHLHPSIQRVIYKDLFQRNDASVLMTTHSTHITSVAPIESIVHLYRSKAKGTKVNSSVNLILDPDDIEDLARYIDAKRGEIYFGKGVVLVEGIAEEYLIPQFAELLEMPLDYKGIIVCNINSTNFEPYVKFLISLGIPYVVITDGDYYEVEGEEKKFHRMLHDEAESIGYYGQEIISRIIVNLNIIDAIDSDCLPTDFNELDEVFNENGFFDGMYTLEVDIMEKAAKSKGALEVLSNIFNCLTSGGSRQKQNFKKSLESGSYWDCLRKIEASGNNIGKGRYAQRLATECTVHHVPGYISNAINYIYQKVDEQN
ncbi:ATP-dependent nuclease [Paenibacillus paridis]|uniref:ATP-dependent nuclease n=1 Tax=Paenibacillus paridis TaxID=2583376 RepID=UPI0011205E44|nr:AAA family ATPase [Paenibacillus paridis]